METPKQLVIYSRSAASLDFRLPKGDESLLQKSAPTAPGSPAISRRRRASPLVCFTCQVAKKPLMTRLPPARPAHCVWAGGSTRTANPPSAVSRRLCPAPQKIPVGPAVLISQALSSGSSLKIRQNHAVRRLSRVSRSAFAWPFYHLAGIVPPELLQNRRSSGARYTHRSSPSQNRSVYSSPLTCSRNE